jgi:hypothetical protein
MKTLLIRLSSLVLSATLLGAAGSAQAPMFSVSPTTMNLPGWKRSG